jgi:hypothetical protein
MEGVGVFHSRLVYLFYSNLVYFVAISYILWPFRIFCGHFVYIFCGHFVYFMVIWYIFRLGMLCKEKSGNPARNPNLDHRQLFFLVSEFFFHVKTLSS